MKKNTKVSIREVKRLPKNEQLAEYSKLAKRANQRMKELENSGLYVRSRAYANLDVERFYQGKKFQTKEEFNQSLKAVTSFLNDKTSTLTGAKKSRKSKPRVQENYEIGDLRSIPTHEKLELAQRWSKTANARMKNLEEHNIVYYAYENAQHFLKRRNRNRFYQGKKYDSEKELNISLRYLSEFLRAKTSTMRGLKSINMKRINTLNDRFARRGINFKITKENEKMFFTFLGSKQYQTLISKYASSNQVIDDIGRAFDEGVTVEELHEQYQNFMNNENMTFEQVNEVRKGRKLLR